MSKPATEPLTWHPAGPVAARYEESRALLAVITGPEGSGKTTASIRRCLRAGLLQPASPVDGHRRAKVLVVGSTVRHLRDQIETSLMQHLGAFVAERRCFEFGVDLRISLAPDTPSPVDLTVMLRPLGSKDPAAFYAGYELTGVWVPDLERWGCDAVVHEAFKRVGRYPPLRDRVSGADAFAGVWGDCDRLRVPAWLDDIDCARFNQPAGYDPQRPGGFADDAENAKALREVAPDFYERLAKYRP